MPAVRAAIEVLIGLTSGPTRDVSISAPDTYALLDAETYAYHAPLLADPAKRALYKPLTLQRIMGGSSIPAGVYIEQKLLKGRAADTLIAASEGADMLVVGNRGRGGVRGLLLGSVSQQIAHHATCPVVIVRADMILED